MLHSEGRLFLFVVLMGGVKPSQFRSRLYEGFTRLRPRALDRVLHSGTFVVELT